MIIEDILEKDPQIKNAKESPVVPAILMVIALGVGIYSLIGGHNDNTGFILLFAACIVALYALKGLIFPSRFYKYAPTREKLQKKEYYFESQEMGTVQKCVKSEDLSAGLKLLETLPQGRGTSLRVVAYTTRSGKFNKAQIQKYVPYEYVPVE